MMRKWIGTSMVLIAGFWIIHLFYQHHLENKYGNDSVISCLKIESIPVDQVEDGVYDGCYKKEAVKVCVQVVVRSHRLVDVVILQGGVTKQGKRAEMIVEHILYQNKNDVDVITGATITSKALLKAVELAIQKGLKDPSAG